MGVWEKSGWSGRKAGINAGVAGAVACVLAGSVWMVGRCSCAAEPVDRAAMGWAAWWAAPWATLRAHAAVAVCGGGAACAAAEWDALLFANAAFVLGVDVLFWAVGMAQGSFWLIDLFWTLIPLWLLALAGFHPAVPAWVSAAGAAAPGYPRWVVVVALVLVWAGRLTVSYLRREEGALGAREDWRYADMRRAWGCAWPLAALWFVFGVQHVLLVGICVPFFVVASSGSVPWSALDTVAAVAAAAGIFIAYVADNQLAEFVATRSPDRPLLHTGLWRYSRHPAHFGEGCFWVAIGLFAVSCGAPWALAGAVINFLVLYKVTFMIEARMLADPRRAHFYRQYQVSTSRLVPWSKLLMHSETL